jgi:hypothetical protein
MKRLLALFHISPPRDAQGRALWRARATRDA